MNAWSGKIVRAGHDRDGGVLPAGQSTLEYCLRPPQIWESDADGNIALRVIGWAVSLKGEAVIARVSDQHGVRKWSRPVLPRSDVAAHYARQDLGVSDRLGFDFLLYLSGADNNALLRMEIFAGDCASGELEFDVAAFYRSHRAQVGHHGRFTGLLNETPEGV